MTAPSARVSSLSPQSTVATSQESPDDVPPSSSPHTRTNTHTHNWLINDRALVMFPGSRLCKCFCFVFTIYMCLALGTRIISKNDRGRGEEAREAFWLTCSSRIGVDHRRGEFSGS